MDCERTLCGRFQRLKGSAFRADVVFKLQPQGIAIPAHKLILSLASPRFAREFSRDDGKCGEETVYELRDIDSLHFDAFLTFIYTLDVNLCPEIAFGLMKLANMYEMNQLSELCGEYILKTLTDCNIWTYFGHSVNVLEDESLRAKLLDFISNSDSVFRRVDFSGLSRGGVKLLLEMESIRVTESELLGVIIKWIDSQRGDRGRRETLGDLLQLIRFPAMTSSEFRQSLDEYPDILSAEEVHEVNLAIAGVANRTPFPKEARMRLPKILSSGASTLHVVSQFTTIFGTAEKPENLSMTFKVLGTVDFFVSGIGILVHESFDHAIHGVIKVQTNTDAGWKDDSFPTIEGGHQMRHGQRYKLLFLIFQDVLRVNSCQWYRINLATNCDEVAKVDGRFCDAVFLRGVEVKFIQNVNHSTIPLLLFK
ncbi:kelch-like protein 40a [Phlebotomus argentipes]|uniref:kelch-like protein 40a n=1 Tax=Phlebotomus argentipes TaxID=94469 RepID=UPI002892CC79|nr:kelch-like protein 40a [Phlebotomus argentipes]